MLAMQAAPPVIDPVLMPERREESETATPAPAEADSPVVRRGRRLLSCIQTADTDPQAAIAEGARWLLDGGGIEAELCVGVGQEAAGSFAEARAAYDRAAGLAATAGDPREQGIRVSIGRMALAEGDAEAARAIFNAALGSSALNEETQAQVHAERARALVALDEGDAARADLLEAQRLAPNDVGIWLLSATLARRQGALEAAGDLIDRALELDREDPAVLLEAGNIAIGLNAYDVARQAWQEASAAGPDTPAGQAAARNLQRLAEFTAEEGTVDVDLPEGLIEDDEVMDAEEGGDAPTP